MSAWVGPTVAISLLIIALCVLGVVIGVLIAGRQLASKSEHLAKELSGLREELGPALRSLNRMGEGGAEVAMLAKEEIREIVYATRRVRKDVEKTSKRLRHRVEDFDALLEVVQDEVEETALDVTAALRTARTGSGMIGQLRRLIKPQRRGRG
jgi:methyl-accepting chemotaxis protein